MTIQDIFRPSYDFFHDDFVVLGVVHSPNRHKIQKMTEMSQKDQTNDLLKMTQMIVGQTYDYRRQIMSKL